MTPDTDVRTLRAFAIAVAGFGPQAAAAGCETDHAGGRWTDDLDALDCLANPRHVRSVPGGGMTLDTREQSWTIPGDAPFADCAATAGVAVEGRGDAETVTLQRWILRPGTELMVGAGCVAGGEQPCPLDRKVQGVVTGRVHRDDPRTKSAEGFAGFPGFGAAGAPGAGWDTRDGAAVVCMADGPRAARGGALPVGGAALLRSGPLAGLAAGVPYAVSVAAGASHDRADVPLLRAAMTAGDAGAEPGGAVLLREDEVAEPALPAWDRMTPVSFTFTPAGARADWRLSVSLSPGAHAHCLLLGPAYVTAQRGEWLSPVLDTFSDATAWRDVEWELDQAAGAADPGCICRSPGSPIAPVRVWWEAAPAAPGAPRFGAPGALPDRGTAPIPATQAGRYFRFGLTLHGRETAAEVAPELAPRDARLHFAGWRPVVRKLRVRYRAAEGRAESRLIAPIGLQAWNRLTWDGDTPGASAVAVDVLDADGMILVADAGRGAALGAIDPFEHQSLRLRVRVTADPADPAAVAVLRRWAVRWTPLRGRVLLDATTVRPGGRVRGLVAVERTGRVHVRVRDSGGAVVARPLDATRGAGTAAFAWDGRDAHGEPVRPGTYRLTATTPGGAGTRAVTVTR